VTNLCRRVPISVAVLLFLVTGLPGGAFAQQTPVFTPGNLVVAVAGCATVGGQCTNIPYSGDTGHINGPAGGYSDDQGSPWTLFQYSVSGATSATYLNSVQLPQLTSGANYPVSNDYGSLSEGTVQLSGDGRFLTMYGFGLNAATFNGNYLLFCPGSTEPNNACVPENGNPAMAQTGSLIGQTYTGNTPVPRVAALIDPYGNVNSSTVLYNIHNQNDARSAYSFNGSSIYVSGQGCKTWDAGDYLCDNANTLYDDTMGVYSSPVGVINDAPTPISGPDNGPFTTFTGGITNTSATVTGPAGTFSSANIGSPVSGTGIPAGTTITAVGSATSATMSAAATATNAADSIQMNCGSLTTCTSSIDTRMITGYGNSLYVSLDSKPGSSSGGYNRSYIGTLGATGSTSVFTCAGSGAGCPTGDGPYGPALMPGFGNTGGTGKYTLNSAGANANSNGTSLSVGMAVNLAPQGFWFASPTVLYVADTGFPKNTSNGPDGVCTTDGGKSTATVGNGGLQKWILNPTVAVTLSTSKGVTTAAATAGSGSFSQGEVGLVITGTGIPAGTTIATVSSAGANVTLSAPATSGSVNVTVSGWSLAYTLYNGLNLVLNSDCNPNSPTDPGTVASTGLYGVTGVVNNGVATIYVTSYPDNDLVNSYLYGIADTLATTEMVTQNSPSFTQLAQAPSDSVFKGVSMAPSLPKGSETITSSPSGLTFTVAGGASCGAGTYVTPTTLTWTAASCTLSVQPTQTASASVVVGGEPTTGTTQYNFVQWQDASTTASSDTVTAPSTTGTYNILFQSVPTVTFPTASTISYGQPLSSSTLSGGSAMVGINGNVVSGTFAWANPSFTPTAGPSSQGVTFTPADTTDYATVTGSVSVTVNQVTPTISTLPTASAITYGQMVSSSTLSGGSASNGSTSIPGTFTFTTPSATPGAGTSSQSVTFTPTDTTDYTTVTGTVNVTVNQAATTISTLPTASAITYGQMVSSSTLSGGSASSGSTTIPGTFTFITPSATPGAGTSSQSVTFTPTDTTDYKTVTGTVNVTVNQATTTISALPTASAITYGQTLASSSLSGGSATSGSTTVPGTFAFTSPNTAPVAGTSAQSVAFTPTDTTDYTTVTGTVNVTVNQSAAMITLSNTTQTYSGSPEAVTVTTSPSGLAFTASYTGTSATGYGPSTTPPTAPDTYSVTVMITDPNYTGQQTGTLTISQVDPTVSLAVMSGMPATTPYGTTVYFSLSTATTPQCPTGTAQLFVDGTATGSQVALSSPCTQPVQFQISTLTAGTHSIYVAYSGDTYFEPENSSPLSYTVSTDSTSVTLAASGTSANVDQPLTFTATVTPASPSNAQPPTGNVVFYDGSTQIGTGTTLTTTSPYTSSFTTSSLAAGAHSISATFTDTDGNFAGNSSPVDVETVNLIVPTIKWMPTPTEFGYGTPIGSTQLNATAVDSNNQPISGSFAYNFPSGAIIPAGTVNLTATFTPSDSSTYASNSASVTLTVDKNTSAVTAWPTASAITYGQTLASSTLSGGLASTAGTFAFTTPSIAPPVGTSQQSVTFTPNDTADYTTETGTVSVTVEQAAVTLSPTSLSFGIEKVGTDSGSEAVTLTNSGNAPLTVSSVALTGTNASSFDFANNCVTTLAAGATCSIHGHFAPTATGAMTATFAITDNAPNSPQTIAISGTGSTTAGVATASFSATSIAFGTDPVGAESPLQTVTLTNTGNATLSISSIALAGTNASSFLTSNTCGSSLAAGANCSLNVRFDPKAAGSATAALTLTDNASNSPQSIALTGTGGGTTVSLSATSVAFGNETVGSESALQTVTLTNTGSATLSISSIALTGTSASSFLTSNTCGSSLAAGANCSLRLRFDPKAAGSVAAALTLADNATNSPQSITLTGTGSGPTTISLSATSAAFGDEAVGTESPLQTITLTNTGSSTLSISSIALTGTSASSFLTSNTCGASLAAGANCSLRLRFDPKATGSASAELTLTDSASNSPQNIDLTGTGQ
jgi:hypothetical protein